MSAAACKSGHVRLRRSDLRTPSQSSDSSKCYTNPPRLSLVSGDSPCLWLVNIKTISFTIPESVKDTKGTRGWLLQLSRERSNLGGKMLGKCKYQGRCNIDIGTTEQPGHHLHCHFHIFWRGLKHALTTMDLMFMTLRVKQNDHQSTVNVYCSWWMCFCPAGWGTERM